MALPQRASEYSGLTAFLASDRLVYGPTLVVPLWFVWEAYCQHCSECGYPPMGAARFYELMNANQGFQIIERGSGTRRRVVEGLGIRS